MARAARGAPCRLEYHQRHSTANLAHYWPGAGEIRSKLLNALASTTQSETRASPLPGTRDRFFRFAQPGILSLFGLGCCALSVSDCLWQGQVAAMSSRAGSDRPSRGERRRIRGKGEPAKVKEPINGAKSGPENDNFAQPSEEDGVPEDMATLVLDNPALGQGAPAEPGRRLAAARQLCAGRIERCGGHAAGGSGR